MPLPSRYYLFSLHCTYSPAGMILCLNAISCRSNKAQSLAPIVHYVPPFAPVSHFVVTGQKSWQHTRSICSPSSREINVIILLVPVSWLTGPAVINIPCAAGSLLNTGDILQPAQPWLGCSSCFTTATAVCSNILCMLIPSLWPVCFSHHLRL